MAYVIFTNNQVDATGMAGEYLKWQFLGGPLVNPAAKVTHHISLSVNKLHCWSASGKDVYHYEGEEDQQYDNGETVEWTGPNDDGIINLHGTGSPKSSNWKRM